MKETPQGSKPSAGADPVSVATKAAEWIALNDHLTELTAEWQRLETLLFSQAREQGTEIADVRQGSPESVMAMQALDTEIEEADERLDSLAGLISLLKSETVTDAIAKIEVGLLIQGRNDWRPHALELLQQGLGDLRARRIQD